MAEAEEIIDEDDEAKELEALLEGAENDEAEGAEGEEASSKKDGRFSFSKKTWILVGAGTFLILLLAGGAYFYLSSSTQNPENETAGEGGVADTSPPVETVKSPFNKVNIFTLEPFFLPLKSGEKETGNFISVIPNFVLSNNNMTQEIQNSLPAIRRSIYNILNRKSPQEYFSGKVKIEERIKREILTTVNPILLAGTGTVTDVVFTQFVVK